MKILLKEMVLQNFKGIKMLIFSPNVESVKVLGTNESGKSTLKDAYHWLLFGKNSANESDFGIKTIGLSNVEHSVQGTFIADGKEMTLKRVYKEKWVQKRGNETKDFTGHETLYWVDEVPCSKSEYETKVKQLIDENIFKCITDVNYFNSTLKWQDRRKLLFDMAGSAAEISDSDVIASNDKLKALEAVLSKYSISDYIKVVKDKKSVINGELKSIPARIDEAIRNKPDVPEMSEEELSALVEQLKKDISLQSNDSGKVEAGLNDFKAWVGELQKLKIELQKEIDSIQSAKRLADSNIQSEYDKAVREIQNKLTLAKDRLPSLKQFLADLEKRQSTIVEEFNGLKQLKFNDEETICPTCKRGYEAEQVEEIKGTWLKGIVDRGAQLKIDLHKVKDSIVAYTHDIASQETKIADLEKELSDIQSVPPKFDQAINVTPKHGELSAKIAELESKIENYSAGQKETVDTSAVDTLTEQLEIANKDLQKYETIKNIDIRIKELQEQEKKLVEEYQKWDKAEYLTDEFTKAKSSLLQENINRMFKVVNFKLFDNQINGGVNECCEVTVNGVNYKDLNTASKINAGIDVINQLTTFYTKQAPIFIDNAESVVNFLPTDSQTIKLYVSEQHKLLHVEREVI